MIGNDSMLACSFGSTPAPLIIFPSDRAATINDCIPMLNIGSFGTCSSPANPENAATVANDDNFTATPCVPATMAQWTQGNVVSSQAGVPALSADCYACCEWQGVVSIIAPVQ